jgi:uncharacterized protein
MRIIRFSELAEVPWKNAGGITREVAAERVGDAIIWRLSMADVASDGAFSRFAGLRRILTVTQGQGMQLSSTSVVLQADFAVPVLFDGDIEIESRLKNGPLRDFNVIYDPRHCHAEAIVWNGKHGVNIAATAMKLWVLHCITGEIVVNGVDRLKPGDTALLDSGYCDVVLRDKACGLAVSIETTKPGIPMNT